VAQRGKGGLCGEWAGADSGRPGMRRELELAQPPASVAEAESGMLQRFVLPGAR